MLCYSVVTARLASFHQRRSWALQAMMHYAGILNLPVSRKSSRTCLLAIWNVKEGWQEGKQTDFESLFHLVSFVSFLLLWGVGLMLPFYR